MTRTSERSTIAVVGGGASGIMVVREVVRGARIRGLLGRLQVLMIERRSVPASSPTFGTPHNCHLLNMRASTMSIDADVETDFTDWLRDKYPQLKAGGYVRRGLFGEYLRERLEATVTEARELGMQFEIIRADVKDVTEHVGRQAVHTTDEHYSVDGTVLCLGNVPSRRKSLPSSALDGWDHAAIQDIRPNKRVAIIGSSLTAVDVLLLLDEAGHTGPIRFYSRTRSLPTIQTDQPRTRAPQIVTPRFVTALSQNGSRTLTLEQIATLIRAEVETSVGVELSWPELSHACASRNHRDLSGEIEMAETGYDHWHDALDVIAEASPHLWHSLDEPGRTEFLREYASIWAMYRHSMPLPNARRLNKLIEQDQVSVVTGLQAVEPASRNGGGHVRWIDPSGNSRSEPYDEVIDATGQCFDLDDLDSPLLANLRARELVSSHRHGGVDVEFETGRLPAAAAMYFVGPLTRGVHLYTNSVETLRLNARATAKSLIALYAARR